MDRFDVLGKLEKIFTNNAVKMRECSIIATLRRAIRYTAITLSRYAAVSKYAKTHHNLPHLAYIFAYKNEKAFKNERM